MAEPVPAPRPPLPVAELHLHLEGTLEPELVLALAERNGVALPYRDLDDLRARYAFTDLQSFLDLLYANDAVLRTETDFHDLALAYVRRAAPQGVRYAEAFFDAQVHTARGVPLGAVVEGLLAGLDEGAAETGSAVRLVLSFLRDRPVAEAAGVLEAARPYLDRIVAVGLDSAEVGHPAEDFAEVFDRARELGLHVVAHAGEEGGPEYVRGALAVGAERIDHGIRALEDPALVAELARRRVPLTVCPLSNVRLRTVDTLADHPLPALLAAGLLVTVNSDDPAYFGGYVGDNLDAVRDQFGLGDDRLRALAANSFRAAFLDEDTRAGYLAEVEAWPGTQP